MLDTVDDDPIAPDFLAALSVAPSQPKRDIVAPATGAKRRRIDIGDVATDEWLSAQPIQKYKRCMCLTQILWQECRATGTMNPSPKKFIAIVANVVRALKRKRFQERIVGEGNALIYTTSTIIKHEWVFQCIRSSVWKAVQCEVISLPHLKKKYKKSILTWVDIPLFRIFFYRKQSSRAHSTSSSIVSTDPFDATMVVSYFQSHVSALLTC